MSYYLIKYESIITTIYNHRAKEDEGTVVFVHATKVYRRSRGVAPLILNLGARTAGPEHICHIYK
jgi:putative exporter of polyketide antibiotics